MEVFILKVRVKRFKRLFPVQLDLEIFVKLTAQLGDCIRKTPSVHYASGVGDFIQNHEFFCNILNGDLWVDPSITEHF